ncbi:MAG: ChbG/HpnK family deacetylase, partial [Deltaproteobacteria bacterium]|nr:ChbG/HpnK family deacetylase [Deltaproteobacteria bacterium]
VRVPRERAPLQLRRLVARMFLSCFPANRAAFWEAFGCKVLPFFGLTLLPEAGRLEAWQKLFQDLPSGVCEIMVHPSTAESDNEHLGDCYPGDRHAEYELLKSPEFADALSKAGLSIIDFRHLSPVSDA